MGTMAGKFSVLEPAGVRRARSEQAEEALVLGPRLSSVCRELSLSTLKRQVVLELAEGNMHLRVRVDWMRDLTKGLVLQDSRARFRNAWFSNE
mmetsp:Transcript_13323/g.18043  ORF Transcript_13323/g.18043 Transcript_13323/m.18043 type:complete len:93 (-) Transcript_13323:9-287(-)